ncbi:metalloregulator ArsR/SmtB family transcription factor [Paraferrimonas haliotis]|uniref:metalloregulator ArsR/SmtB family transcription factor n=1 Tax=Paraferrimonas haliotis TaxID=2013866 RepID=UPI000BA93AAA|nr:metalloregulator ArsR/SmtB family transcription factor [Paraferrimonas haliotis]
MSPIQFYKCLADEIRLKSVLLILQENELCVCELMVALNEVQPKVSRHLAQLRKCGLLVDRRQGQWVFYRINPSLPEWAKRSLTESAHGNVAFLSKTSTRLANMGNRPDRLETCC